jgi:hypothetical protein
LPRLQVSNVFLNSQFKTKWFPSSLYEGKIYDDVPTTRLSSWEGYESLGVKTRLYLEEIDISTVRDLAQMVTEKSSIWKNVPEGGKMTLRRILVEYGYITNATANA